MGIIFKAYYQCCGCGIEFDNPDKVRNFKGTVENGDRSKIFIQEEKMYCVDCLPLALDFENKCPETVKIVAPEEQKLEQEKNTNKISDLENKIININKQYLETLEFQQKEIKALSKKLINFEKSSSQKTSEQMVDDILREEARKFMGSVNETIPDDWPKPNELIGKDESSETIIGEVVSVNGEDIELETTLEEPEITKEIKDSETEQSVLGDSIPLKAFGKYLVLYEIKSEANESDLAKRCGHKDVKSLRETCGNKSLMGIYYSIDKFIDDLNEIGDDYRQETVKVINKIFFGVPNVVERKAYIYPDYGIGLIEKYIFDDKIEPIEYVVPEEVAEVAVSKPTQGSEVLKQVIETIKTKETSSNIYKKESINFEEKRQKAINFNKPIIVSTQKKKFSKDTIGDEYI
jgi:hypothetical protein